MYDVFTRLDMAFAQITDMKIKKTSIAGTISRKLAKYLLKVYAKND